MKFVHEYVGFIEFIDAFLQTDTISTGRSYRFL